MLGIIYSGGFHMYSRIFSYLIFILIFYTGQAFAQQGFPQLDRFEAENGVLDVTIIAAPRSVNIGGYVVNSNVFTICKSSDAVNQNCPNGSNPTAYGGSVLAVNPGDRLKITLVNRMTNVTSEYPKPHQLVTNLHLHGALVRARGRKPEDQISDDSTIGYEARSIGDFIFVGVASEKVGPIPSKHQHAAHELIGTTARFDIKIPDDHPDGIFWFHPHPHGHTKPQVSSGMAGMIVVGAPDYLCLKTKKVGDKLECADTIKITENPNVAIREILLKDAQLLDAMNGTTKMKADQAPDFCGNVAETNGKVDVNAEGFCKENGGQGRWVYSLNGVSNPSWVVPAGPNNEPQLEVWRIQNASANITYNLCFSATGGYEIAPYAKGTDNDYPEPCPEAMPFQVLSMDGVAYGATGDPGQFINADALQRRVILMPGSRIELAVTPRVAASECKLNGSGRLTNETCKPLAKAPDGGFTATLQTLAYVTGGDDWQHMTLGSVTFKGPGQKIAALNSRFAAPKRVAFRQGGILFQKANPQDKQLPKATDPFEYTPDPKGFAAEHCVGGKAALLRDPQGNQLKRRIYFAIVNDSGNEYFLLGNTIVTMDGESEWHLNRTAVDGKNPVRLQPFNAHVTESDLCVKRGEQERWELVNLSHEVHNFHIHQGKFAVAVNKTGKAIFTKQSAIDDVNLQNAVITNGAVSGTPGAAQLHDTMIVPRASAAHCTSSDLDAAGNPLDAAKGFLRRAPDGKGFTFDKGVGCAKNKWGSIELDIPFDKQWSIGKYVFHCHILEHEDLGMMSSIRVIP